MEEQRNKKQEYEKAMANLKIAKESGIDNIEFEDYLEPSTNVHDYFKDSSDDSDSETET